MSRLIALSTILIFAGSTAVHAQDSEDVDYMRSGVYVGAFLAGAWYKDVTDDLKENLSLMDPPVNVRVAIENPLGYGGRVGYRFLRFLAVEAQIHRYARADVEISSDDFTIDAIKIESLTVTGNLKAYMAPGRVQPFALAGVGLMHFNTDDKLGIGIDDEGDAFAARFGAGVDFYLTENVVLVAEGGYILPTGQADGLDHLFWSVGLQYRF